MATVYKDNPPQYFPQPFQNNSVNAQGYYVTVTDGVTTIFRKGKNALGQDEIVNVGNIPKTGGGGFTNTSNASKEEIQYFSANARKTVTEQAVPVVNRGIGGSAGGGNAKINQILGTNLSSSSTPTTTGTAPEPPLLPTNDIISNIPNSDATNANDAYLEKVMVSYPSSMNEKQDRIKFTAKVYEGKKDINIQDVGKFSLGVKNISRTLGHVILPIQPSITDDNGVDWGGTNLNPIQAYAASASLGMIDAPGGDITGAAGRALNEAAQQFKTGLSEDGYKRAISMYFAQEAVGAQNFLSRTSASVLNPNLELLFNGPTLRPFNFTFRLSPRSAEEAKNVKIIINFFKRAMAVKTSKSAVFLKAPNVFQIEYQSGTGKHKSLNKIKECALLGCNVDYTPDGTYMTFNDEEKTMTSYQLTLRFSELDPIYSEDYIDNHQIGY
jgi:hypothetical protein